MSSEERLKNEILSKLGTIYSSAELKPHEKEWIQQVVNYIKEVK